MTEEKRKPADTSKDLFGFFAEALLTGGDQAIERQEAAGQDDLVNSDTLPTDIGGRYGEPLQCPILEASGVKFLGVVDGDPLFQYVELPQGWKKLPTDHSMWSKLVDEKGRERAMIFYKAAFYDRSAHMRLSLRFSVTNDYKRAETEGIAVAHVLDCENIIYSTEPLKLPADDRKKYEVSDKAKKAAEKWLNKHYPDWRNPAAYWG